MNNEKPVSGETNAAPVQESTPTKPGKKPVIVYIMILFIAAFLLMALSFAMHQRSSQEALGQLETSFNSTIQDMQATQEHILELEKEITQLEHELESAEKNSERALADAQAEYTALEQLYCLQQKYSAGHYQECKALIDEMETSGSAELLHSMPITTDGTAVTAPAIRFQQLKSAVVQKLAEAGE